MNAPLPTAWSFPFQSVVGIHTSILMSESLDGVRVAVTRQNAGKAPYIRAAAAEGGLPPADTGGANAPASTARAAVIVAWGSASDARLSHDGAGAAATCPPAVVVARVAATMIVVVRRCFIVLPP